MPEPKNQIGSIRVKKANWNLPAPMLFEEAVGRGEGRVAVGGSLVVATGKHTGRAANDKFIVRNAVTDKSVWWGKVNKPFPQEKVDQVRDKMLGPDPSPASVLRGVISPIRAVMPWRSAAPRSGTRAPCAAGTRSSPPAPRERYRRSPERSASVADSSLP